MCVRVRVHLFIYSSGYQGPIYSGPRGPHNFLVPPGPPPPPTHILMSNKMELGKLVLPRKSMCMCASVCVCVYVRVYIYIYIYIYARAYLCCTRQ